MARPGGMQGRRVKWLQKVNTLAGDTFYYKEHHGYVINTHWEGETCYCLVADADGQLSSKRHTELTLTESKLLTELPTSQQFVPKKQTINQPRQ